jgi:hypothetical protein
MSNIFNFDVSGIYMDNELYECRHDITEILLKVALNTITLTLDLESKEI